MSESALEIVEVRPEVAADIADLCAVADAARAVDAPWEPTMTPRQAESRLRWGWDLEPPRLFLGRIDQTPVVHGQLHTSERDNTALAWTYVAVHPDRRRQGLGSAMLTHVLDRARAAGRTSAGIAGWDVPATHAFAARHGFEQKTSEIPRRQHLDRLDEPRLASLRAQAEAAASDYVCERCPFPLPDDELDAVAAMASAINDAPRDELEYEDEVIDASRLRAFEQARRLSGQRVYRVWARHRGSGELAGQSLIIVDPEHPEHADQADTSVVRAHRGHRLGLLLKLENLAWLREAEPAVRHLDTWNAESNAHMIGVNQALGYEVLGRELAYQRSL